MTHGSLFSGIGGFDLAAEWMGWENVFHCEINEFCQKVLKYHFHKAISYADIKTTDFSIHRGRIDIITGGFPCQPFSLAGKRKGAEDDRHLWPEMLRAIREIQPSWVVCENVYGIINWSKGLVFEQVQIDLENEGYQVQSYILPACGVNASHKRDRVWFVAHSDENEYSEKPRRNENSRKRERVQQWNEMELINFSNSSWTTPNTDSIRQQRMQEAQTQRYGTPDSDSRKLQCSRFRDSLSTPRIFRGNDGLPNGVDRVKALGNSIVPQLVYQIFKTIEMVNTEISVIKPV
jgi:DNA (cytosine-5)-methyltransferase 1